MRALTVTWICFIFSISLFGIDLESKQGVAYISNSEVYFYDLDHRDTLRLTNTQHNVTAFALSADKRFLAYSKKFKMVEEPGNWDSIVPQIPVCSIVMMDLEQQKIIKEIFPSEYEWIEIEYWINSSELLCTMDCRFSVDGVYLFHTTGRVDTIPDENWDDVLNLNYNQATTGNSSFRVKRDKGNYIHLLDDEQMTDTVIFKESRNIQFEAISPDLQSMVWSETIGQHYTVNNVMYSNYYHLYLKNIPVNESKIIIDEKDSRFRKHDRFLFSPDSRLISINWYKGDHMDLCFLREKKQITIEGQVVDWIDGNRLVLVKDEKLYIYNVADNQSILLVKDVRKPQFVR